MWLRACQQGVQQFVVLDVESLIDPKTFQQVVGVFFLFRVELL